MKTSTDASIFHMAFELELHVDTNKNKDYFLHGTTYNALAPSDCFDLLYFVNRKWTEREEYAAVFIISYNYCSYDLHTRTP